MRRKPSNSSNSFRKPWLRFRLVTMPVLFRKCESVFSDARQLQKPEWIWPREALNNRSRISNENRLTFRWKILLPLTNARWGWCPIHPHQRQLRRRLEVIPQLRKHSDHRTEQRLWSESYFLLHLSYRWILSNDERNA